MSIFDDDDKVKRADSADVDLESFRDRIISKIVDQLLADTDLTTLDDAVISELEKKLVIDAVARLQPIMADLLKP